MIDLIRYLILLTQSLLLLFKGFGIISSNWWVVFIPLEIVGCLFVLITLFEIYLEHLHRRAQRQLKVVSHDEYYSEEVEDEKDSSNEDR